MTGRLLRIGSLVAVLVTMTAPLAHAQPRAEIGASLINGVFDLTDDGGATVGIPSGGFGILANPGVYASFFVGERVAIEPQIGFIWASNGDSAHIVNLVGQIDYFVRGTDERSVYVFANAGVLEASDADYSPKSFGGGVGYRIPVGDRLTFRLDGRYTHVTSEFEGGEGDLLAFTLSIGGVFGQ
jgi:hypothetical protein